MFDQVLTSFRKATDSTIQIQQEMFRQWLQQLSSLSGTILTKGWADQIQAVQKKWSETVTDMLNKHRETLDARYQAGIRTIEDAFQVAEAKDPEQFRKLAEELWRHNFDCLKNAVESQLRDFQAAAEKGLDVMSKPAAADKS